MHLLHNPLYLNVILNINKYIIMKKSLLFIALLCSAGLFAQNLVSTTPQNKKVVLEEFTGINCVFCPDGHTIAQAIKDQNPEDVILVNVHVGGFANPGSGQPDFRTSFGNALANQSGLEGYPSGTVNRHVFSGSNTALGRGQWTVAANQILQQESYVNIAGTADIDVLTNELTVTVEVYYTGDSPEDTNKLNVALLQDNTLGPQTGGNMGNNYVHMHRLVHFLTGQWGADITNTTEGSFDEYTFTYEIPNDYRGVDVVLEDLKVVAYVAEGNQEILTGDELQMTYTNVAENDVSLNKILDVMPTCLNWVAPEIEIENRGSNTLSTLDITYTVNNSEPQVFTWTGSLEIFEKEVVQLDEITFTQDDENILVVTIPDDEDNDNNSMSQIIEQAAEGGPDCKMQIVSRGDGTTTTWEIKNINNEVIYSGGPYTNNSQEIIDLTLPEDCYEITVYDSSQNGTSIITLVDGASNRLFRTSNNFGAETNGNFKTNSLLSVNDFTQETITLYPNPTNGIIHIENAEGFQVEVYNILGKVILSKSNIINQDKLDLSNLTAGVYYVKFQNENTTEVKKVVVK